MITKVTEAAEISFIYFNTKKIIFQLGNEAHYSPFNMRTTKIIQCTWLFLYSGITIANIKVNINYIYFLFILFFFLP